ncbi:MAG: hypothetical protein AABY32_05920 [Nanoarchaeota archaeon]
MTPKEAEIKYGRKMFNKMQKSGELNGITVCLNKNGEIDIPSRDLERAYDIITKGWSKIEWD